MDVQIVQTDFNVLWKLTLDLPNEVLEGIFSKISIRLLLKLRSRNSRLRLLTKNACDIREQKSRFSFNSPLEIVYEPFCRKEDLDSYIIRNYTPFTSVILFNHAANAFLEDMRPYLDKKIFPSSLSLDCEVRFPDYDAEVNKAKNHLKLFKSIAILDLFGSKLSFLSMTLEYGNPLSICEFKRIFVKLNNLKGLVVCNATFSYNKDMSNDNEEDRLPLLKLPKLETLKLLFCQNEFSEVLLRSCSESLLYLNMFTCSAVNSFFHNQCAIQFCKMQYLSVYSSQGGFAEGICNFLQTKVPNLKGLRLSAATNIFPSRDISFLNIALEVLNLNTLQIMGRLPNITNLAKHLQVVKKGLNLKTLYIPYWFLSRFEELHAFVSKLLNLTRLVFVYEGDSLHESTYLIPVNWISLAKRFSLTVQIKSIEIKYGRTRFCVQSGVAELDSVSYLRTHPM